jgi:hypothetical protein
MYPLKAETDEVSTRTAKVLLINIMDSISPNNIYKIKPPLGFLFVLINILGHTTTSTPLGSKILTKYITFLF